jgi:hypothetical protein
MVFKTFKRYGFSLKLLKRDLSSSAFLVIGATKKHETPKILFFEASKQAQELIFNLNRN